MTGRLEEYHGNDDDNDLLSYDGESGTVQPNPTDHESQQQDLLLCAQLVDNGNANTANNVPLVHAENVEAAENRRKRKLCLILLGIGVVFVAVVLGLVFGLRPPSTPNDDNDDPSSLIVSFLVDNIAGGQEFEPDTPQDCAANWIATQDPMRLSITLSTLIQRFVLALFYLHTIIPGQSLWNDCNPPIDGQEDDGCIQNTNETRWLTGTDECSWFGISCDDNGAIIQIVIGEHDLHLLFPPHLYYYFLIP